MIAIMGEMTTKTIFEKCFLLMSSKASTHSLDKSVYSASSKCKKLNLTYTHNFWKQHEFRLNPVIKVCPTRRP